MTALTLSPLQSEPQFKLRESLSGGRVKGVIVRAHQQWVRERLGEAGLARVYRELPRHVATDISDALSASWCSFGDLVLFDRAIARVCGRGEHDLMRELGRFSARINLSTVFRSFQCEDVHEFFRRSSSLHTQFQDFGVSIYQRLGPDEGRIEIIHTPFYSPAYCASACGYYEEVIAMHGGAPSVVAHPVCRCAGDDRCRFSLRWRVILD